MAGSALIVVDMLQSYDFEDADVLARNAGERLPAICDQIERARGDARVIYVNDNLGEWRSDRDGLVEHALAGRHPELVEPLRPTDDDRFVLKLRHSIFYQTPLDHLLRTEDVDAITLVGQVTEQCILYSALDAYLRHLSVTIVRDAVVPIHDDLAEAALRMMQTNMHAEIT